MISAKIGHALDPVFLKIYSLFFKNKVINPNVFTIAGMVFAIISSFCIAFGFLLFGAIFLLVSGFFDLMDGALARNTGNVTIFGAFLDSVLDRYSDLSIMFGLFIFFAMQGDILYAILTFFASIGIAIIPYAKARAEASSIQCNTGILERPERLIILFIGLLFNLLPYVVIILAVLTHATVIQRILFIKKSTDP
ncbi:MAG: CDP-alcohol phosphatidyltransferase family protein [Proteobacteria bacterium]|nr:CDP-alcohol phosphatidyltransferase family protein [Pseudomonadota bacterium]